MNKTYTIDVQEREDGELYIELTDEMLDAAGFEIGDALEWIDNGDGSFLLKKKATEWVLVEAISMFRTRYMVQVPAGKSQWALDSVTCGDAKEFSQKHLDETIVSHRVVSREEALGMCALDNAYSNGRDDDKKIETFFTTMEDIERSENEGRT